MKITRVLPVVLLLTLVATTLTQAQTTEKIALYADRLGTDCSVADHGVTEVAVYMFHVGTGTRTGASFRAPKPACWAGASWSGDELNGSTIYARAGNTQSQYLDIIYFGCVPLPIYLGKMLFDATGTAESCCAFPVLPILDYPTNIGGIDCFSRRIPILGGSVVINENASCPCAPPLAVESTTWGRVKSLYN
jgi:hypothetical protein